jgi:hypothetical protein
MIYTVTLRFQFPAWDERDGITWKIEAASKREAIAKARREAYHAGHVGSGSHQGRVTFSAKEIS